MDAVRLIVVVLNVIAGVFMGMAVVTIMGPGPVAPERTLTSEILWVGFHVGPCAALAGLAVASRWVGSRALPVTLVAVTLVTAIPALLVARHDVTNPPGSFSLTYGIFTFLAVCAQYVAVLATALAVAVGWAWRRRRGTPSESLRVE